MVAPKKDIPKLGPKKTGGPPAGQPANPAARPQLGGVRKASSSATRPSATPTQSSADVPKRKPPKLGSRQNSEASLGSTHARRPSVTPRRPSNLSGRTSSIDQSRKPPKLPPRQDSGSFWESPEVRKPSIATRRPSNLSKTTTGASSDRKPPKLAPKKDAAPPKQPQARKASNAGKPDQALAAKQGGAAHKVDEEQQDLKSILSDSQCGDLVQLTTGITSQMRRSIEDNFNATATLDKIRSDESGEDQFASLDYDPGTVDVAAYDKERKLRDERQKQLSTPKVKELKAASLKWFGDWRSEFLKRVDETVNPAGTSSLQQAQGKEAEKSSLAKPHPVQKMSASAKDGDKSPIKLEELFPRVPTSLTKMPLGRRTLVLHSFLLLLLSLEHYNAASRIFLLYLASSLKLGLKSLRDDEEKTAKGLLEAAKQISASKDTLAKGKESEESRRWKMRLATVAGAAIVGLSGGYAAPMIAASVGAMMSEMGLGASAAAGYLGAVAGNTYLVGSLFGAYGGRMTGEMMRNLSADVEDFAFLPVHGERKEHDDSINAVTDSRRLRVIIAVSGWLLEKEEVITPWRVLKSSAECFALRFEIETLMSLGQSINTMSANDAYGYAQSAFTQRAMVTDLTSAIWPIALVKIARVVENPFSLAKARSDKAGKVLAEALINRTQGERPVTLVGYSLGARVIWSCLTTLAERKAFGLVESVVMLGAPVPSDIGTWRSMRAVVTGRLINVYSKNDYLLAFLYQTSSLQYGVAGLMPISGLAGVENFDVSETVSGHLRYRYLVGSILQKVGLEDIDKDEVAKEADAFKRITDEEDKQANHDYVEEVKEGASELYKQYAKRGQQPPTKKISDKEADKQVSAMEKEVHQKTQKGLMQWAVEQLYLSRPAPPSAEDVKNVKSDPKGATKGTTKSVNKTADAATKSMYQRAKEAVYISRSGGSEGEDAAKGKLAEAQGTASSAVPSSYLATAAGYIPTSYLPGFGAAGDAKDLSKKAPKVGKGVPESKEQNVGKGTDAVKKKKPAAQKSTDGKEKPNVGSLKSDKQDERQQSENNNPTIGTPDATKNTSENESEEPPKADASENAADDGADGGGIAREATDTRDEAQESVGKEVPASEGYSSYIPSFGFGSSTKNTAQEPASINLPSASDTANADAEDSKKDGESQPENQDSTDTTPTKAGNTRKVDTPAAKASGYTSYLPSFGFGRSAPSRSPKTSAETSQDQLKDNPKDEKKDSAQDTPNADPEENKEETSGERKPPLEDPFVD